MPKSKRSTLQDPDEIPKSKRLELACNVWKDPTNKLSIRKIARQYGISHSTLGDRIHGKVSKKDEAKRRQRLTPEEEEAIVGWILRLQAWGWPPRVERTRSMAKELLNKKGDTEALGINWIQKFLSRHPELKTRYSPPLDKERALAQDPDTLRGWFDLFQQTVNEYQIVNEDIYNMDEKGFMQGVIGKLKVMVSKYERNAFMTQYSNQEWVSLIECVSMDGRILAPWIIFKGKQQKAAWYDFLPEGAHIALSENGWNNNEIGLQWIQNCFEPQSRKTQKGLYRLLVLDGHASHINTQAIEFCEAHKILLLCLPPHTTHLLQPLDVGIFAPLACAYKSNVQKTTRLGGSYSVNKIDFLELYQAAKASAITPQIITRAWAATGLSPFDPEVVLQHIPKPLEEISSKSQQLTFTIDPSAPPEALMTYTGPGGEFNIPLTPTNTQQVRELLQKASQSQGKTSIQYFINLARQQFDRWLIIVCKALRTQSLFSFQNAESSERTDPEPTSALLE